MFIGLCDVSAMQTLVLGRAVRSLEYFLLTVALIAVCEATSSWITSVCCMSPGDTSFASAEMRLARDRSLANHVEKRDSDWSCSKGWNCSVPLRSKIDCASRPRSTSSFLFSRPSSLNLSIIAVSSFAGVRMIFGRKSFTREGGSAYLGQIY